MAGGGYGGADGNGQGLYGKGGTGPYAQAGGEGVSNRAQGGGGGGGYNGYVGTGTTILGVTTGGDGGVGGNGGGGGGGAAGGGGGGGGGGYGAVVSGTKIENQTQVTGGVGGVGGTSEGYYKSGVGSDSTFGHSGSGGVGLYVLKSGATVTQNAFGLATGGAGAAYSYNGKGGSADGGTGISFRGMYSAKLSNTGFVSGGVGGAGGYTGYGGAGGDGIANKQGDSVANAGGARGGSGGRGLDAGNGGAGVSSQGLSGNSFVATTITNSSKGTITGGAGGSFNSANSGGVIGVGGRGGDGVLFGVSAAGSLTNAGLIEGGAANGFLAIGGIGVAVTTALRDYAISTTIINQSTGTIRGGYGSFTGGVGVEFTSTNLSGTLVNAGAIIGGSSTYLNVGGAGVSGDDLTVIDTGQITGAAGADAITFTGGDDTLAFGASAGMVGSSTLTGALDVESGDLVFNQSVGAAQGAPASVTVADTIIGAGAMTQAGAGVLTLIGDNSFSGGTTIAAGALSVSADDNLGAASGGVTFDGGTLLTTASFASGRAITLDANGILNVAKGNTSLTGSISGSYALSKFGPGTLTLAGDNSFSGGTTIQSGVLSIVADDNLGAASGSLTLAGGTLQATASIASARNISLSATGTIDVAGGPLLLSGVISGAGGILKTGGGTLTLLNTNSFTGPTTINAGVLQLGNGATDGSLSSPVVGKSVLALDPHEWQTFAGRISDSAGTLPAPIVDNGVLALDPHGSQTFAFSISGNVGTLSKIGAGTAVLTGASGFSGHTTISGGTLQFGNGTTNGSVQGPITDNSLLSLDPNGVQSYRQTISGPGGLSKIGAGTAVLTVADTLTGLTTISAGTLQLGNGSTDGSVSGRITDNALLSLDPNGSQTFANQIAGSGSLTKTGAGTAVLSGANAVRGATTIAAGTLAIDSRLSGSGPLSIGAGALLLLEDGGNYSGALSGPGKLEIAGPAVTLSAGASLAVADIVETSSIVLSGAAVTNAAGDVFTIDASSGVTTGLANAGTGSLFTNAGTLLGNGAGNASIATAFANSGSVSATSGAMTFLGSVANNGTIDAASGLVTIKTTVSGNGTLEVGSTGTLSLALGTGSFQVADFLSGTGLLDLAKPMDFAGTITGFGGSDQIDLLNTAFTSYSTMNNVLTVKDNGTTVANLTFTGSNNSFSLNSDNHGGTLITFS